MAKLVLGFQEQAAPAGTLQPFATTSPAAPASNVQQATEVENLFNGGPSDTLLGVKRLVVLDVDFTDILAQATKLFGPIFPDNAIITSARADIITGFTSGGGNAATIGIGFATDAVAGIRATAVLGGTGILTAAAFIELLPVNAVPPTVLPKLTAARQLQFLRAGGQDLTAGRMILFIEFYQSV